MSVGQRQCGASDLNLPVIGIGCWAFGGGDYWGAQDQKDVDRVAARAIDLGCNFFDTAEVYNDGESERSLGAALKGRRGGAIIGSKVSTNHCYPDLLRKHCEESLKRLDTDYLDLYMIHWPINAAALAHFEGAESSDSQPPVLGEALDTLAALKKQGKIRYIGVSNYGAKQLDDLTAASTEIACNELPYSLLARAIEYEITQRCRENGIGILAYMPLMQGLLTGNYKNADELPSARTRTRHFRGDRPGSRHGEAGAEKETFEAISQIVQISDKLGVPANQLALAWCVAHPEITCTIVGARTTPQLEDNAAAASIVLDPEIIGTLDRCTDELKKTLGPAPDLFEASEKSRTF